MPDNVKRINNSHTLDISPSDDKDVAYTTVMLTYALHIRPDLLHIPNRKRLEARTCLRYFIPLSKDRILKKFLDTKGLKNSSDTTLDLCL